jgi:hypothetical protein
MEFSLDVVSGCVNIDDFPLDVLGFVIIHHN